MLRRFNRLIFTILCSLVTVLLLTCGQPENVVAPPAATYIHLSPEQLPPPPDGYFYKLWVIDTNGNYDSLGSFLWDSEYRFYYETDSTRIDSIWEVDFDMLNPLYNYLALTIENSETTVPTEMGPIMLMDTIVDPEQSLMNLVFPVDFGLSYAGFALETPTDKDSYSKEASGLWFAYYTFDSIMLADTTDADFWYRDDDISSFLIFDTVYWRCNEYDGGGINCIDSSDISEWVRQFDSTYDWFTLDTSLVNTLDTIGIICLRQIVDSFFVPDTLLMDTFVHISIEYEFITAEPNLTDVPDSIIINDTCSGIVDTFVMEPYKTYIHELIYTGFIDQESYFLDKFVPNYAETPDLTGTKWHYKGWVFSPYLPDCDDLGMLSKPTWLEAMIQQYFPGYDTTRIISTGNFSTFARGDDANPYSDNKRVPNFPGEDFLYNLPCGADSIYFASQDSPASRRGEVFVTLEPDNFDENTNFPLILFSTEWDMPNYVQVSDSAANHNQSFLLNNRSGRVPGNPFGFPGIRVLLTQD